MSGVHVAAGEELVRGGSSGVQPRARAVLHCSGHDQVGSSELLKHALNTLNQEPAGVPDPDPVHGAAGGAVPGAVVPPRGVILQVSCDWLLAAQYSALIGCCLLNTLL